MANNKITLKDGTVLLDLTGDTVTAATLGRGKIAHDKSGEIITGTMDGGDPADIAILHKEVRVASALTSGNQVWATPSELVAAGILAKTGTELSAVWNHYYIEVFAKTGAVTHRTRQLTWLLATDGYGLYNGSTGYRRRNLYHGNSTTSASSGTNTSGITTNTTAHIVSNSSTGVYTPMSSSYGCGIATYDVRIIVWGKK